MRATRSSVAARSAASALALFALALACASDPPRPDWVTGSSARYPSGSYTQGVGTGSRPEDAADRALQSIAEQTGGETEGARIVETWDDPEHGSHWALAVLDRSRAIARLQAELAALQASIVRARATADTAAPEQAVASLGSAVAKLDARDTLRRRIVALGGQPASDDESASAEAAALRDELAQRRREMRVEVDAFEMDPRTGETGDRLDGVRRALIQRVLQLGFSIDSADTAWGNDPVWLRVEAKLALDRLELLPGDRLVAVQWELSVEITDVAGNGDVVAVLGEQGRATHLNEKEARRLAESEARSAAGAGLEAWLAPRAGGAAASR